MIKKIAVIIVTYNSKRVIGRCLSALMSQKEPPSQVIIADTGSKDPSYLEPLKRYPEVEVHFAGQDVGFCAGNNLGIKKVNSDTDYLLLLNPDAFLKSAFLKRAVALMEKEAQCGILTGTLLGYDLAKEAPSGYYDSRGVFQTWYGRWYDRDQRKVVLKDLPEKTEEVQAICGALMFCRFSAIKQVLDSGGNIFDPSFYMYKEDIDLSLRVQKAGWQILYHSSLEAYHCRGWGLNRQEMPRRSRLASAKNELKIHLRQWHLIGVFYSMLKYVWVRQFNG